MLTARFFAFSLVFPGLLLLGTWLDFLIPVALVYGLGLIFLMLMDRYAAGGVGQFRVERRNDHKLSLGAQNRIVL